MNPVVSYVEKIMIEEMKDQSAGFLLRNVVCMVLTILIIGGVAQSIVCAIIVMVVWITIMGYRTYNYSKRSKFYFHLMILAREQDENNRVELRQLFERCLNARIR